MIVRYDNPDKIVVQHKSLINGRFDFTTLNELRIFVFMLLQIGKDDTEFKEVKVACAHLHGKRKRIHYDEIKLAASKLTKKTIEVEVIEKKGKRSYQSIPLMAKCSYTEGEGYVKAKFNNEAKPYLLGLSENFASSKFRFWCSVSSVNSYRLYWLLKQFDSFGRFTVGMDHLREMLKLENKYQQYTDLRKRILLPVQQDLEKTDMAFTFKEDRCGTRQVQKLIFFFKNKGTRTLEANVVPSEKKRIAIAVQQQLNFDRLKADEALVVNDTVELKLLELGLNQKDVQYYRSCIDPQQLGRAVYILHTKWIDSNMNQHQKKKIVKECLDEKIGKTDEVSI